MKDTKTKILDAASELFLQGGSNALSVRAISKRAGMSTIGIYSHFQGKQGILDALYIEGFERVSEAMDVLEPDSIPREAVLQASRNYLDVAEKYEAHNRLIFGESDGSYVPSKPAQEIGAKAFFSLVKVVATLLPEETTLEKKQDAALQIWSLMHGFISLKQHAISNIVDMSDWKTRVIKALEILIDAIESNP